MTASFGTRSVSQTKASNLYKLGTAFNTATFAFGSAYSTMRNAGSSSLCKLGTTFKIAPLFYLFSAMLSACPSSSGVVIASINGTPWTIILLLGQMVGHRLVLLVDSSFLSLLITSVNTASADYCSVFLADSIILQEIITSFNTTLLAYLFSTMLCTDPSSSEL